MRKWKKLCTVIVMAFIMSIVAPVTMPNQLVAVAQAATIKLKKTSLSLNVGKTYTLEVVGTKSKVTWTTSDKSIATVSSKGKVTAKKAGKATITATVNKKKYTCKVTVKQPAKNYLKSAPFEAREIEFANMKAVIPDSWQLIAPDMGDISIIVPPDADMAGGSAVTLVIGDSNSSYIDYELLKKEDAGLKMEEYLAQLLSSIGMEAKITNIEISDVKIDPGKVLKVTYDLKFKVGEIFSTSNQVFYQLHLKDYFVQVTATEMGESLDPSAKKVAEYLVKSIQTVK